MTLRCWETVACVIGKSRASSPQQRSCAWAIVCKIRNRVGSARALVIFMTCCGVISVLVHPNHRYITICLNIHTAVSDVKGRGLSKYDRPQCGRGSAVTVTRQ